MTDHRSRSLSHIVLYQTNPHNPRAVEMIIENAQRYLSRIPGLTLLHVAPRYDNGRAVAGFPFDVGMNMVFESPEAAKSYMSHPDHLKFVEFVLEGRKLADSTYTTRAERKQEFMDYILNATPGQRREVVLDDVVPQSEIVWQDEMVPDFAGGILCSYAGRLKER